MIELTCIDGETGARKAIFVKLPTASHLYDGLLYCTHKQNQHKDPILKVHGIPMDEKQLEGFICADNGSQYCRALLAEIESTALFDSTPRFGL